jgi:hypothetical protein
MTWHWAVGPDWTLALHRMLLRLSGRAPDGLVLRSRQWLAEGRDADVAQALAFAALAGQCVLPEPDAHTLTALLGESGHDATFLLQLSPSDGSGSPPYTAAPSPRPDRRQPGLDLTPSMDADCLDAVDRAAIEVVASEAEPIGLWRSWRLPRTPTPYPPPRRVYLAQTRFGEVGLTGRLQDALVRAGEQVPIVEVFDVASALSSFSRQALDCSVLLWAERPTAPIRLAPTFDMLGPDGQPTFSGERLRLEPGEATQVAA